MTRHEKSAAFSRRALLKAGGALVISIGAPIAFEDVCAADAATAVVTRPALTPDQLSSYIAVNADGTVSAYFGKMDMGQGLSVAIRQMVAEELDVAFKDTKIFIGDTATSVNQGGASGSTGVQEGGKQMRMAAAEARRVLVGMAAAKLDVAADLGFGCRVRLRHLARPACGFYLRRRLGCACPICISCVGWRRIGGWPVAGC